MRLSRGSLEPSEYDYKEHWSWKTSGRKPWFVRAVQGRASFKVDDKSSTQSFHMNGQDSVFASHSRRASLEQQHVEAGSKSVTVPMRAMTPRGAY